MEFELICGKCHHRNRTSSRFCASCGSALERQCPKCSKVLSAAANYCDSCGTRIEDVTTLRSPDPGRIYETLERRQLTVMFCDLRDSTHLSEQLDPEDLRQVLVLYQDCCAAVIQKYGGYVSRYMGDGILTLFGYPNAHDDDAYRAVLAGMDIVSEIASLPIDLPAVKLPLSVRIGIATGVVVTGDLIGKQDSSEQTIVGRTPNLAARLQAIADTNGIVVNETTYRLVNNRVRFESVGPTRLRGISTPVKAYRVQGLQDPAPAAKDKVKLPASLMVGRKTELNHLLQQWGHARKGSGRAVLICGEAGIGKSRLLQELKTSIDAESRNVLELKCSSYLANSALHPVFEFFRENVETGLPAIVETIAAKDETRASWLRGLVTTVSRAESVNSGSAAVGSNPVELPFDAFIQLSVAISEDKPLLLVFEDFHWADPSTERLIDLLVDRVPLENMLVVVTSRPESRPQWITRSHATQLTLDRLNLEDAKAMVLAHAGNSPLADDLCRVVVKKSDGVPLFIEELTKSILQAQDDHSSNDKNDSASALDDHAVPETLRDSLMARLDRLGEAKVIAQFGAAIGREFTYHMLRVVTQLGEARLATLLSRLVSSELVLQSGVGAERKYQFKHSLIQDTAYESLVRSSRIEFHRRIAAALEKEFASIGRSQPELMARHYSLSGQTAEAVACWNLASERALQQSANQEALHHAGEGLRHVTELADGPRRDELLLSLYIHLSTAISGTRGDAVPEVEDLHQKAEAILQRSSNASLTFSLTREMHAFYLIRGPLNRAVELGHQMQALAENSGDLKSMVESWRSLGWTYICHGELGKGQELISKALARYDSEDSRDHTRHDIIDPGGVGMINLAWAKWLAGNSDTAANLARDAIALSRDIDHPYTLAYTICMAAAVFQCRREPEAVLALVDEAISIANKRDYRYWIAWGTCLQGWAQTQLGRAQQGIQALAEGLQNYRDTGAKLFVPHILCMTAEAKSLAGGPAEARDDLVLAADIESSNQIYFYAAETQRLLATAASDLGETGVSVAHFQQALEIARTQQAASFELRTALGILQSPFASRIVPDAQQVLARALDRLSEGQDDADYRSARDLVSAE